MPSVLDLPYDVLREIFTGLSAVHVLQFLRTSRKLYYPLIDDDSTWYHFCAPYGITDTDLFRKRSFRIIYGRLLHRYGALLGLWCSDYPFRGNIVQFRIVPDRWLRRGEPIIVGEVWEFTHADQDAAGQRPEYPKYIEFMQIGFVPWKKSTPKTANDVQVSWHIRSERNLGFLVHNGIPPPWVRMDGDGRLATPSFHVIAPSNMTIASSTRPDHLIGTPDIVSSSPWYDSDRGLPPFSQEGPPAIIESKDTWYHRRTLHYVPGVEKPASVAFFPPPYGQASDVRLPDLHNPTCGYGTGYKDIVPRYYPVCFPAQAGHHPASPQWTPDSVVGVWLGDYGTNGTECLYLEHHAGEGMLRAWKLTGDVNVPRGACSWAANLQLPLSDTELKGRAFAGQGTTAQHGIILSEDIPVRVVFTGRDELVVSWAFEFDMKCIRYRTTRGRVGDA
ncbi:hypothetical protein VTO73DRAFT_13013 [Trametes versicolor]